MFEKLKKIFSVDDEQFEEENIENTQTNFDTSLSAYNNNMEKDINLVEIDSTGKVVVPHIKKSTYSPISVIPTQNPIMDTSEIQVQARNSETLEFRNREQNTVEKRKLDFGETIDNLYGEEKTIEIVKEQPKIVKSTPVTKKVAPVKQETKDTKKSSNETGYVLRDILSPHGGVVRKETNTIQKEKPKERTKIIRLRDDYRTVDLSDTNELESISDLDNTIENIDTVFEKLSNNLEQTNLEETSSSSIIKETQPSEKEVRISETSKFTLIEDSTGEMRLFIEEEE